MDHALTDKEQFTRRFIFVLSGMMMQESAIFYNKCRLAISAWRRANGRTMYREDIRQFVIGTLVEMHPDMKSTVQIMLVEALTTLMQKVYF